MADNRRSFLHSAFAWLGSLPLLGWIPVTQSPAEPKKADDTRLIRWVPVTERLPDTPLADGNSGMLLLVASGRVICGWMRMTPQGPRWGFSLCSDLQGVTHWAELPQSPAIEGPQA